MKLGPSAHKLQRGTPFGLNNIWEDGRALARMGSWGLFLHHLGQALRGMVTAPVTALLTVFTIALTLSMLGLVVLLFENTDFTLRSGGSEISMSIFLKDKVPEQRISQMLAEARSLPLVRVAEYRSAGQALEVFRKELGGRSSLVEGLEKDNPLPASIEIQFREANREVMNRMAEKYRAAPGVDEVLYNEDLIRQFAEVFESIRKAGYFGIALLVGMCTFIIASAIRLALYSHRDEIEIMGLVGATDFFTGGSYIIEGVMEGLFGALLSLLPVYLVYVVLNQAVSDSTALSTLFKEIRFLSPLSMALMAATGVVVGLGGSILSVRRFRAD